jgi:hypothetical protein
MDDEETAACGCEDGWASVGGLDGCQTVRLYLPGEGRDSPAVDNNGLGSLDFTFPLGIAEASRGGCALTEFPLCGPICEHKHARPRGSMSHLTGQALEDIQDSRKWAPWGRSLVFHAEF